MKITILTWGSDGDVQPYIALGLGLQKTGHRVSLATHPDYQEFVERLGLDFRCVDCENWYKNYSSGTSQNPFALARYYNQVLQPFQDSVLTLLSDVCQGTEMIIFSPPAFPAYELVEKLGVPGYAACVVPLHTTRAFSSHFIPSHWRWGSSYNYLTHLFFNQLFWQAIRQPINQWRKKILHLPSISLFADPISRMNRQQLPFLYGYSPTLLPKPSDWPDWVDVTGYWFLDSPVNWQPPTDLIKFLDAGSPPVYIGFGNKGGWESKTLTQLVLEALKLSRQRGILLIGEDLSNDINLPEWVFPIEWIPFDWLFPKLAAVVHHGGCGTIHTALRFGVPNIIVPYNYDNFFWAERLVDLGLAVPPIRRKQLSAEKLAKAIQASVSDEGIRMRVGAISKKVQVENGVKRAVEVFEQYLQCDRYYQILKIDR
ncbi:glycosyltransferase family 1 protein [Candidatus Gracilibacteria bacterium]|nr:glycosyltransferase family 1 protein [Candidatus Gracilibacteria bacterium]NJP19917.1 glycosyltransferase family 1 protein [Hydrococcus sp. CRU_1_1]